MSESEHRRRRGFGRRVLSPITLRILAVNGLALLILVAGLLYLGEYRERLIEGALKALGTQAGMFAGALGEGGVAATDDGAYTLVNERSIPIVRRLAETTGARARLFLADGTLMADSRRLLGAGGVVEIEALPPLPAAAGRIFEWYDRLARRLPESPKYPPYLEQADQHGRDYEEVVVALSGEAASAVRDAGRRGVVLSAAVPVQRYKQVLGALLLTRDSRDIEEAVLEVRLDIVRVFLIAATVTVLLSLYLARAIARPIRLLAAAAERVRRGRGRKARLPDFGRRRDEIARLAAALREMTESLWDRIDAGERFAADVAHEIKNPLSSLRSAVETAARVKDAEQQKKLMAIIEEDVRRLDRLISDISAASRLDAELSRAEAEPVNLTAMLKALADLHRSTAGAGAPRVELQVAESPPLVVSGVEDRLVQVFRNLLANAVSFSPAGGTIRLDATRDGAMSDSFVVVTVDDEGPGIPEGKQQAIFERFYSERPEGEKFGMHSGLGLSISRQIVQALGGDIHAENRKDETGRVLGARFVVRLPEAENPGPR
jgi:two-component system sensor histidine kinase ChvG